LAAHLSPRAQQSQVRHLATTRNRSR